MESKSHIEEFLDKKDSGSSFLIKIIVILALFGAMVAIALNHNKRNSPSRVTASFFVRVHGIGPWTSVLSGQRSTTELYTRGLYYTKF